MKTIAFFLITIVKANVIANEYPLNKFKMSLTQRNNNSTNDKFVTFNNLKTYLTSMTSEILSNEKTLQNDVMNHINSISNKFESNSYMLSTLETIIRKQQDKINKLFRENIKLKEKFKKNELLIGNNIMLKF